MRITKKELQSARSARQTVKNLVISKMNDIVALKQELSARQVELQSLKDKYSCASASVDFRRDAFRKAFGNTDKLQQGYTWRNGEDSDDRGVDDLEDDSWEALSAVDAYELEGAQSDH